MVDNSIDYSASRRKSTMAAATIRKRNERLSVSYKQKKRQASQMGSQLKVHFGKFISIG